jgi:hypothetical protein
MKTQEYSRLNAQPQRVDELERAFQGKNVTCGSQQSAGSLDRSQVDADEFFVQIKECAVLAGNYHSRDTFPGTKYDNTSQISDHHGGHFAFAGSLDCGWGQHNLKDR